MRKIITVLILLGYYSSAFTQVFFSEDASNTRYQSVAFDYGSGIDYDKLYSEVDGVNYGIKSLSDTWSLKGSQVYLVAENGWTISSVTMYYSIYKSGEIPSFSSLDLAIPSYLGSSWWSYYYESANINIIDEVSSEGTWIIEFQWIASTNNGDVYLNKGGSNYKLYFTADASLPVELTTFTAFAEENKVALAWETATEVNNYGFEIERQYQDASSKNQEWEKIGFVEGHGNSNSPKTYSYTDNSVTSGDYYYRLRQVDIDGQFEYSDVVEVNIEAPNKFELAQNYPNPFNPRTSIQFSLTDAANVSLIVYNTIGQQVAELINQRLEAGIYNEEFDATNLNSGMYIYVLKTEKVTITRKMILMK